MGRRQEARFIQRFALICKLYQSRKAWSKEGIPTRPASLAIPLFSSSSSSFAVETRRIAACSLPCAISPLLIIRFAAKAISRALSSVFCGESSMSIQRLLLLTRILIWNSLRPDTKPRKYRPSPHLWRLSLLIGDHFRIAVSVSIYSPILVPLLAPFCPWFIYTDQCK